MPNTARSPRTRHGAVAIRIATMAAATVVLLSWPLSYAWPHGWTVTPYRHYGICARDGRVSVYRVITTAVTTSQRPGVGYVDVHVHEVKYDQPNPSLRNDAPLIVPTPVFRSPIVGSARIIAGGATPSFSQRPDHTLAVTYIPYGIRCDERSLPHWVLAAALLGPALFVTYRWLAARRRHPPGACAKCGYDLRATPMQCPECGLSIAK